MAYRGKRGRGLTAALVALIIIVAAAAAALLYFRPWVEKEPEPSLPPEPKETDTAPPTPTAEPSDVTFTPTPTPTPEPEPYDFTQPVPKSDEAAADYFSDAVFIGDSRTDGFLRYSGVQGADGIYYTGLSIFGVQDKKVINRADGKKTVLEALAEKQYGKVYLALGVNELGYKNDAYFYETYLAVIDAIREIQPDAIIYIENLIPLNESKVNQSYLRNDHLRTYNELMARVAEEKQVAYLDLYSAFADEDGQLPGDASNDGVHMKKPYCEKWLAYLRTHVVSRTDMGLEEELTNEKDDSADPAVSLSAVDRLRWEW